MRTRRRFFQVVAFAKFKFRYQRFRKPVKVMLSALILWSICFYVFLNKPDSSLTTHNAVQAAVKKEAIMTPGNVTPRFIVATGALNIHVWREVCGSSIQNLRQNFLFPDYPDEIFMKFSVVKFQITDNTIDYGQRIFGFLHPPQSDEYNFAIASDDESELWFSPSYDPEQKRLIARVYKEGVNAWTKKDQLDKYPEQISEHLMLSRDRKYYIEVVHKQGIALGFVQVYWKRRHETDFYLVSSEYLSSHTNDVTVTKAKDVLHSLLSENYHQDLELKSESIDPERLQFLSLPLIPKDIYLPLCDLQSNYLSNGKVYHYQGRKAVQLSSVYPADESSMLTNSGNSWSRPNKIADRDTVQAAMEEIVMSLKRKTSKKYVLKRIHKVLNIPDPVHGVLYSVDLEIGLQDANQSFRLSEHVFGKDANPNFCFPRGMNWNNKAKVYFILPVKEQGRWVYHFNNQITIASSLTGDTSFHVIVVDFESEDIDMTKAFNTTLLRNRHTIVPLKGKFYKTMALNKAVEHVPSVHDILFLFDLHIDVPLDILDSARKNTIEGRLVYAPIVGRLHCGSTYVDHKGYWEMNGFGLMSIYKSDWVRFKGMNTEDYKYKWGGEDWDLLDRVINAELKVVRIKHAGLYHHYHTKQKSWN
ncbi:beta-1,4-N-acetylgalactosaminyltransferase 3-like [Stylophora pistillata]|uniref:beta-1,4-N-acetylgalactosaminyltransferase 3-like n=1 Tax=Stylophora pistillata TaxID=50429 RepID=UPI000C03BEA0|nr:beta-1,4-N-acetylgalactosaminyltransferase 3-like [Stylophora pistillata]